MYECYNEGIRYLIGKYRKNNELFCSNYNKNVVTYDKDLITDDTDYRVHLLITQYYLHYSIREELYFLLKFMKII